MGQPFVGYSGQMLDRWLREAGHVRDQLWVDNAVRCWLPGNREPKKAELDHCMEVHVKPALRSLRNLKVVVPVGMVAARACLGKKVTDSVVGAVIRRDMDV
jgi:uracil-DNA glycosylase family 4